LYRKGKRKAKEQSEREKREKHILTKRKLGDERDGRQEGGGLTSGDHRYT